MESIRYERMQGTIRVSVLKPPVENPNGKARWEVVLRTENERLAQQVERTWVEGGYETRRE